MHESHGERRRENEERFAQANERTSDVAESLSIAPVPFLCECSAPGCTEIVRLTLDSYRWVREQGYFVSSPGHADPRVEAVVADRDAYLVVEKRAA
jgi:hypothetical protein